MAAIDLLVYVLPGRRRRRSLAKEDYVKRLSTKLPRQMKAKRELEDLRNFLLKFHNPWTNTDMDSKPDEALIADEIAVLVGWAPPGNGRRGASKVSRKMKILFGPGGMESYGNELRRGIQNRSERKAIGLSPLHDVLVEGKLWGTRDRPTDNEAKSDES